MEHNSCGAASATQSERPARGEAPPLHAHPAVVDPDVLLKECVVTRQRRSGPGGQHRNKVETAVRIVHSPTGVTAEASERRSQEQNRAAAIMRLRVNLALEVPAAPAASPTELWLRRCAGGRLDVNAEHADFPPLLAEALSHIVATEGDVGIAAAGLRVTPSQLLKFLKAAPPALERVNRLRQNRGLRPLK